MVKKTGSGFGDVPKGFDDYEKSKIVIVPVPYDETSTWLKGADKAPEAIIEASRNMYLYDIETGSEVYRKGIHTDKPVTEKATPEKMVEAVKARVTAHIRAGKFVVTLGGEHSISVGAAAAHADAYKDICVLQLDAHADLQEEFNGSRYNHACTMARIREVSPIVQVGMRSMDAFEHGAAEPGRVFYAEKIHSGKKWMEEVLALLPERVYITIDIDAFDISIMPSTGTPEPGGMLWYDTIELLDKVARSKKIVGFDIVELCPNELSKPYDFLVAKLIYRLLSYIFR